MKAIATGVVLLTPVSDLASSRFTPHHGVRFAKNSQFQDASWVPAASLWLLRLGVYLDSRKSSGLKWLKDVERDDGLRIVCALSGKHRDHAERSFARLWYVSASCR